jgi:Tfp pilus assembly protein PilV
VKKPNNRGISLAELLVAVLILGVTLPGILLMFVNATLLNEIDRSNCIAVEHAQYVMEEIKSSTLATVDSDINAGNWDWDTDEIGGEELAALRNEEIDTSVSGTDFLTVTVQVTWEGRAGRQRSIDVQTYIWRQ